MIHFSQDFTPFIKNNKKKTQANPVLTVIILCVSPSLLPA